MAKNVVADGVVHKMPDDLRKALISKPQAVAAWADITPLARNEWICWSITVKKPETRVLHIKRTVTELIEGKSRPCCWIGCFHRKDKPISKSVQWVLEKQSKKSR